MVNYGNVNSYDNISERNIIFSTLRDLEKLIILEFISLAGPIRTIKLTRAA